MAKKKTKKQTKSKPVQKNTSSKSISNKKYLPLGLLAALLAFVLYANTFGHDWALDDFSIIKENWVTQSGLGEGIATHLTHSYRYGYGVGYNTLYRPLSLVFFTMEWSLVPDSPGFMHFMNVLWYALTGLLLFFTLKKVLRNYNVFLPFATTLLFIAHPLHTESVSNIKGRDDILGFFFILLAIYWLWDYLKKSDVKWLALSVGSYFLALLAKESSVTFVAVFPLIMYFFTKVEISKNLKTSAFYLLAALLFIFIRSQVLGDTMGVQDTSPLDNVLESTSNFTDQKATAILILGKYLGLLFFPHPLVSDAGSFQIPITTFGDWRVLLSLVIHFALFIYAILNLKKKSILSFAILFYILNFSITSNLFITFGIGYAERLLYLPLLGFNLGIAWLLMKLLGVEMKSQKQFTIGNFFQKNMIPTGILAIILIAYSGKTIVRNQDWKDSFTLYDTDVKTSPNCAKLQFHYGLEMNKKGKELTGKEQSDVMNQTKAIWEKAIEIYPEYHDAYSQLGLWHYNAGQNNPNKIAFENKAEELFNEAIKHKPNNEKAYNGLGMIYFGRGNLARTNGNLQEAERLRLLAKGTYEKILTFDPRNVDATRNLGVVYALNKEFDKAIQYFRQGLKFATDENQKADLQRYLQQAIKDKG